MRFIFQKQVMIKEDQAMNEKDILDLAISLSNLKSMYSSIFDEEKDETFMASESKVNNLVNTYNYLKEFFGDSADVDYELYEPHRSMGYISIKAKSFVIDQTCLFSRIIQSADNIDMYGLADGGVRIDLSFYDLTVALEVV